MASAWGLRADVEHIDQDFVLTQSNPIAQRTEQNLYTEGSRIFVCIYIYIYICCLSIKRSYFMPNYQSFDTTFHWFPADG